MSRQNRRVLLSLHDVTPFHLERLNRAERLFESLGIERIAYLLIPNYHGRSPAVTPEFRDWCNRERPFTVEWILHGFYHLEQPGDISTSARVDSLKRKYATAGEGEFLSLDYDCALDRINRGIAVFEETLGIKPSGFIPPAWLYHSDLANALRTAGLDFWESRNSVQALTSDALVSAPIITWATRTPMRKASSILGTPVLEFAYRPRPVIRLAVHPFDFDHPETIRSITSAWQRVIKRRKQISYSELFSAEYWSQNTGVTR